MSDLICELVKEDDPFLREIPDIFDFDSPQVDPEKLEKQLFQKYQVLQQNLAQKWFYPIQDLQLMQQ